MTSPLQHDYISIPETHTMERSSEDISSCFSSTEKNKNNLLNLKQTELRLGLPGSTSPERKPGHGVPLFGKVLNDTKVGGFCTLKNFVSGAKRGFCDATDGSGNWALSIDGGSEIPDLVKGSVLYSPRHKNGGLEKNNTSNKSCLHGFSVKDAGLASTSLKPVEEKKTSPTNENTTNTPASRAPVVGWPPIKSFRKNTLATNIYKIADVVQGDSTTGCIYVKVSMDGAPYLRKVDLKTYFSYAELSSALQSMFSCFTIGQCTSKGLPEQEGLSASRLIDLVHGSEYVLTYEDKDSDWMLVGDVPWNMFTESCKRLRIMKDCEAIGLAPRSMEKCKSCH
ncbi:Auxin-responsive protein [Heracleum sosnowskyi]|uniref:Auxin-responsive protein n=1 Tax=Heracleum sosnowskyi TaxID=360622 RepID=A0AAD8GZK0_9APIA|nr:Auxin-responsive protein [Heracleum sosnowskyi]